LRKYFRSHASIARAHETGFILESPTWRASADWGAKLGYSAADIAEVNRRSIGLMQELREEFETPRSPMVISGCVGPRGDGYDPGQMMSEAEAEAYHRQQVGAFGETKVDLVTAITMTNTPEAIGLVRAAAGCELPVVVAFTVETDGRLPTGQDLKDAVAAVTRQPMMLPPITWSTARIRRTSRRYSRLVTPGSCACGACAPMRQGGVMPN
jgi:S-methylmethionine-dependent homocysteine/selenocysteine methylase